MIRQTVYKKFKVYHTGFFSPVLVQHWVLVKTWWFLFIPLYSSEELYVNV